MVKPYRIISVFSYTMHDAIASPGYVL